VTLDPPRGAVFAPTAVAPTLIERVRGRWSGRGSFTHWSVVARAAGATARPAGGGARSPRFLVRVDDFPRWDRGPDGFVEFNEILDREGVRYLLGVIPRPLTDPRDPEARPREWTAAERAALATGARNIEVALHGMSHRPGPGPVPAEIVGVAPADLDQSLAEALDVLRDLGHTPTAYIPPYNALDPASLAVLGRRFDVVCGGPESVRWLGRLPGPCRIAGVWYLPSYPPAYGRAVDVAAFVRSVRDHRVSLLVPITLHWAWEEADRFEGVRRLVDALAGTAVSLSAWTEGRAWIR
jgi:peptidoglycan/xylan/chitin deacetylase (PgdA/CDA1 family)